jgi:hypothetical protein
MSIASGATRVVWKRRKMGRPQRLEASGIWLGNVALFRIGAAWADLIARFSLLSSRKPTEQKDCNCFRSIYFRALSVGNLADP